MTKFNRLSNRELDVVKLLLQGKSNKLIAQALGISNRTVEFHLKNIYTKYQVSSRVELILKLGNTTGKVEIEKLGLSTVDNQGGKAENRDMPDSRMNWGTSFRDTVSIIGKELEMKNLLNSKHVLVGVTTALFTGFVWIVLMKRFGHTSPDEIKPWILPLFVIMTAIGLAVGLTGKRNGNSLLKVCFSALFGTGLGSLAMLPLTVVIVYPIGKLAEWLGLVDRATIPNGVAETLVYGSMLGFWLIVGIITGIMLLFLTIKKTRESGNSKASI
jgi:DNA-binding CsgD family transcriptional regulator